MNYEKELKEIFDGILNIEDLPEEARIKWNEWKEEEKLIEEKVQEWMNEKAKKKEDAKDVRRDTDFEIAYDRLSRAGYNGKHGNFEVPFELKQNAMKLYEQVKRAEKGEWSEEDWLACAGITKAQTQRNFIRKVNEIITDYGWNPSSD
uniref:Uncharacterized protein n=1 Tax=Panagrolaimus superbus TaxID=310955 RepID=A0A914Z4X7_9BILA